MTAISPSEKVARQKLRRSARWISTVFWLVQFAELSLASGLDDPQRMLRYFGPRLVVFLIGLVMTFGIVELAATGLRRRFRYRVAVVMVSALIACAVLVCANYVAFYILLPVGPAKFAWAELAYMSFGWSWFFLSVGGSILAVSYNLDVRDRERRLRDMEVIANEARMMALRYQLSPHFLFNTLNSVAALIARRSNEMAEAMVKNLADFLRATLELDPLMDVPLKRELELQSLYLAIEEVRFPDRLRTVYDVPDELACALVPALITQPLVENAIRHSVARNNRLVTVRISARRVGGQIHVIVEDDGAPGTGARTHGTGVGMKNVRARLSNRFGERQTVVAAPGADGGFRTVLEFPYVEGECAS